ncbi:MAG: hypothetical protein K6F14_08070 [Clostridiales bacterium]|nr:hypothetical protein [Clostridiales bacterium]
MKKILGKFKNLKTAQRVEVIIALTLSLVIVIGFPVYAWFANAYNLETMAKVKELGQLDLRAGHAQPLLNFTLDNIDIEDMEDNGTAEYRVFSVRTGSYSIAYRIQLAHTTNIPLKYTIYKATEVNAEGANTVSYKPLYPDPDDPVEGGTTYYYEIGDEVDLAEMNAVSSSATEYYGRTIAESSGTYYDLTYDEDDDPEMYAVPLYLRSDKISTYNGDTKGDYDYYVLKIEWDQEAAATNFTKWNRAENNKETDIIYISVAMALD